MVQARLLEELGKQERCFISALTDAWHRPEVLAYLKTLRPGDYTPEEWDYCLSYVYGRPAGITCWQDVQDFLKSVQ